MRKGFQRILFAVRDIDAVSPAALRKVAALAAGAPARVGRRSGLRPRGGNGAHRDAPRHTEPRRHDP